MNEVLGTVDWGSPLDVCKKIVGLLEQRVSDQYEVVKSFDDYDEVVIYTPEGKHVGTKMKVWSTRATSKSMETRRGQKKKMKVVFHTTLIFNATKCQKIHASETKEDVVQKEAVIRRQKLCG